jgi:hypothetical protein
MTTCTHLFLEERKPLHYLGATRIVSYYIYVVGSTARTPNVALATGCDGQAGSRSSHDSVTTHQLCTVKHVLVQSGMPAYLDMPHLDDLRIMERLHNIFLQQRADRHARRGDKSCIKDLNHSGPPVPLMRFARSSCPSGDAVAKHTIHDVCLMAPQEK